MAIDYERLKAWCFPEIVHGYSSRDVIQYALGLGIGHLPTEPSHLDYVYEKNLKVMPTFGLVLAKSAYWQKDPKTGLDWVRMLHGEEGIELHRPLRADGTVVGRMRISGIVDKGHDRGALIAVERRLDDQATGEPVATVTSVIFCRGDGGFGDRGDIIPPPHRLPDRAADAVVSFATVPQQALIYRLSGGDNLLHVDPDIARAAGYDRPILQGLCTFGISTHAAISAFAGGVPNRIRTLRVRFSAPAYPGETIRTELWRDGGVISFRASVVERDVVVMTSGRADIE